jgi:Uma2 family endonuclease
MADMTQQLFDIPDINEIITEDDTPVDNLFSAKQQRLLVEPLYTSWRPELPFIADANVGVYSTPHRSPIVPDVFLSLDAQIAENWFAREHRTYFIWEFGKPPDVVIEIVSNKRGQEADKKLRAYAEMRVWYYVIYDPQQLILDRTYQVYELQRGRYIPMESHYLEDIGLGLTLWHGTFEMREGEWLRWCNVEGDVLLTGAELAARERERVERLAAQLRALGIEPEL